MKNFRNKKSASDRKTANDTSFYASTKSNYQSKEFKQFETVSLIKQNDLLLRNHNLCSQNENQNNILTILQQQTQKRKSLAECYIENAAQKIIQKIEQGIIEVSENKINLDESNSKQQQSDKKPKYLDPQEHKKLIKKLNQERKNNQMTFKNRSLEIIQKIKQEKQEQENEKKKELQRELSQRKAKIKQKLDQLNILRAQRHEQSKVSNAQIAKFKNKKSLEQINQEKFQKKFVLPKIEQQQKILEAIKKSSRKPINFTEIKKHEQSYFKQKEKHINVKKDDEWSYSPPQYVPKSYLMGLEEQKRINQQKKQQQRQKQEIKKRKQQFINLFNENLKLKLKDSNNKKAQTKPVITEKINIISQQPKQKQKNIDYLEFNKNHAKKKAISSTSVKIISQINEEQKKQNAIINQLHSKRIKLKRKNQIRLSNLNDLLANKNLSPQERLELLILQSQKLDQLAKRKLEILKVKGDNSLQHFETVDILLTSIKTKVQILQEKKKIQSIFL